MKDKLDKNSLKTTGSAKLEPWRIVVMVLGGILIGFVSGLFGGGGGIIIVPLLAVIGKLSEREAHATSIAVVFPIAIVCGVVYYLSGTRVEFMSSLFVTIGVIAGGILGSILLKKLSSNVLKILFYLIMIVAGIKMIV